MIKRQKIISALATPLDEAECLHRNGFDLHFEQQCREGVDGVLVGGSMGAMQLLRHETYSQLVRRAADRSRGTVELLIGVGDSSFSRTMDRIQSLPSAGIDGLVVLPPFMYKLTQDELYDYYSNLAAEVKLPLFLYDLPQLSRNKIEAETVRRLARNPRIAGIKCSDEFSKTEAILDLDGPGFRIVVANPKQFSEIVEKGVSQHLDGIFALAPKWTVQLRDAVMSGDDVELRRRQQQLNALVDAVCGTSRSVFAVFTTLLNHSGIPGNFAPRPIAPLTDQERESLLDLAIIKQWLVDQHVGRAQVTPSDPAIAIS